MLRDGGIADCLRIRSIYFASNKNVIKSQIRAKIQFSNTVTLFFEKITPSVESV